MLHVSPSPRVFAALSDPTRLELLDRLRSGRPRSITALSAGTELTRQAVTRHLEVLADVGLVRDERHGRERLFSLDPAPLDGVAQWASQICRQWDNRLDRLEAFLDKGDHT